MRVTTLCHLLGTSLFVGQYALAAVPRDSKKSGNGHNQPDPSTFVNVKFNGDKFVNKGLVGFGLIPSNLKESTGDTFGGVGSAIAIQRGTWNKHKDGTYTGVLVAQPDRGFNVEVTIDYQARQHLLPFTFTPYYGSTPLSFNDSQRTFRINYQSTLLYSEQSQNPTTGLDPLSTRPASKIKRVDQPIQPVANSSYDRISVDAEGLVLNEDGSFWVSDEYGPYIHRFSSSGVLVQTIQPPKAFLPFQPSSSSGEPVLNFTGIVNPLSGRTSNQGFEGLTSSPAGKKLFALLQSATIQDGGDDKKTSRYARFLEYDMTEDTPKLKGEYVIPLPQKESNGNTLAQSEVHYLNGDQFLTLARDGDGNGGDGANSAYKSIDIFDISKATNIAGTKFDDPSNPIATDGELDDSIEPAEYQQFVSLIDDDQLAKFGLHNGKPIDATLVNSKWESLALAPVDDKDFPDDYFLLAGSDNDFLTTQGVAVGQPYNAGKDVDTQFLIFRVTLPTIKKGDVEKSIGI